MCWAATFWPASSRSSSCRQGTGSGPARATTSRALVSCVVVPGFDFADFALARLPTEQLHRRRHQRGVVRGRPTRRAAAGCPPCRCASARRTRPRVREAANNFRRGRAAAPARASRPPSTWLEQVVGDGDVLVALQFDHHPHAVLGHLGFGPRRRRLGVEDARPRRRGPCRAAPRRAPASRARASSARRSRAARVQPSTARSRASASGSAQNPVVTPSGSPGTACRTADTAAATTSGSSESMPSAVLGCMCTALAPAWCAASAAAANCSGVTGRFGCWSGVRAPLMHALT